LDSQIPLVRTSSKLVVNCIPDAGRNRHAKARSPRIRQEVLQPSVPRLQNRSPIYPTLRANPYPEVTDLFCRLPLSTLFYQLEAVNLGDLLRL
ncbi:hypothetical protein CERSUDRAFT_163809, partial [Gelatoporia subvermispora B]